MWIAHIDDSTQARNARFDMIIGGDLMEELGLDISFKNKNITWDDVTIPMKKSCNSHRQRSHRNAIQPSN